ncbi:MAG: hypothetical protein ACJA06_000971 [Halocynthiibacter sp.]|jgi:hypothetical protein
MCRPHIYLDCRRVLGNLGDNHHVCTDGGVVAEAIKPKAKLNRAGIIIDAIIVMPHWH